MEKQVADRFKLPLHVRQIQFELDCEMVPIFQNQLGYFSDLRKIECIWDVLRNEEGPHIKEERCCIGKNTRRSSFLNPPEDKNIGESDRFGLKALKKPNQMKPMIVH